MYAFTSHDLEPALIKKKLKTLSQGSDWRGAAAIARDLAGIAAIAWLHARFGGVILYLAAIWAIGALQFAISECLLHEASHWTLFRTRRLNDWSEALVALPFFQTMATYRKEHRTHHARLMQADDHTAEDYAAFGLGRRDANMFWLWFVKPVAGYSAAMFARNLADHDDRRGWIKIAAFWATVAGVAAYAGVLPQVAMYWLVPLLFCRGAFLYWSEVADHHNTRSGSRTRVNRVANWLFHNNGYHHAHHRYPGVTSFNLKRAHELTKRDGDDVSHGFFETYRQLRAPEAIDG